MWTSLSSTGRRLALLVPLLVMQPFGDSQRFADRQIAKLVMYVVRFDGAL